jgi:hypothetical protein
MTIEVSQPWTGDERYPHAPQEEQRSSFNMDIEVTSELRCAGLAPDEGTRQSQLLPDRKNAMPVIEHYFKHFNNTIPLFDQPTFMRLLKDWYTDPTTHCPARWAAIQVVLALGLRTPSCDGKRIGLEAAKKANVYLNNALSVLPDLATRDEDLLGLQTLLGIIFLPQNRSDQKPASAIIASAMRLAHRLGLHSSMPGRQYSSEESLKRSRVFWIAYALDKVRKLADQESRALVHQLIRIGNISSCQNAICPI